MGLNSTQVKQLTKIMSGLYRLFRDKDLWLRMQKNAMRHPVGWETSAPEYKALYADILKT